MIGRPIRNDMNQSQIRPDQITDADLNTLTRRRAARMVATRATDADDARQLLDLLGLNPSEGKTT